MDNLLYTAEENRIWRNFEGSEHYRIITEEKTQEVLMAVTDWIKNHTDITGDKIKETANYLIVRLYSE